MPVTARLGAELIDLLAGHGAIAAEPVRFGLLCLPNHRTGDFFRRISEASLYTIGAIVTRTAFYYIDLGVRNKFQNIAGLQANILHTQVTRDLVSHLAKALRKFCLKPTIAMPELEILERVVESCGHGSDIGIVRKQQGQLLIVLES